MLLYLRFHKNNVKYLTSLGWGKVDFTSITWSSTNRNILRNNQMCLRTILQNKCCYNHSLPIITEYSQFNFNNHNHNQYFLSTWWGAIMEMSQSFVFWVITARYIWFSSFFLIFYNLSVTFSMQYLFNFVINHFCCNLHENVSQRIPQDVPYKIGFTEGNT